MPEPRNDRWRDLWEKASVEVDPQRRMDVTIEIDQLLEEEEATAMKDPQLE